MIQIGREGARRQHRAVSLFAVIQCWLRQLDGVAFQRPHLERLLGLHRFKRARMNWLKEDFEDFFPHCKIIKRAGTINSLSSVIVSRVSLENAWPKGRMTTKQRIESIPASYVQRTAVTAALDLIRRRRARRTERLVEPHDTGDKPIGPSAQVSGPDREFDRDELAECVARAVDGLADARRVVVRLYLAGYPREEIAGLLGWSEPKTRNLLYRGLTDLRTRLTELGVGPGRIE